MMHINKISFLLWNLQHTKYECNVNFFFNLSESPLTTIMITHLSDVASLLRQRPFDIFHSRTKRFLVINSGLFNSLSYFICRVLRFFFHSFLAVFSLLHFLLLVFVWIVNPLSLFAITGVYGRKSKRESDCVCVWFVDNGNLWISNSYSDDIVCMERVKYCYVIGHFTFEWKRLTKWENTSKQMHQHSIRVMWDKNSPHFLMTPIVFVWLASDSCPFGCLYFVSTLNRLLVVDIQVLRAFDLAEMW